MLSAASSVEAAAMMYESMAKVAVVVVVAELERRRTELTTGAAEVFSVVEIEAMGGDGVSKDVGRGGD